MPALWQRYMTFVELSYDPIGFDMLRFDRF